jgi:hypothetical protein
MQEGESTAFGMTVPVCLEGIVGRNWIRTLSWTGMALWC